MQNKIEKEIVIKVGTDLLKLNRFIKSAENGKGPFLKRLFTPQELKQNSIEQLGSIFSLKEAAIKALSLSPGDWLKINTNRTKTGKVGITFLDSNLASKIISLDTSLSHDGGWIIAVVVAVIKNG
jgi:phosphopantetheine--protein transferase-like protein